MMTNPIDQDLAMQSPSSTSPLPWLSQTNRTSKKLLTSSFPTGKHQVWNFSLLYSLFLLRNVLGSSLESSSQVHRFTHQKKDKNPPKSLPLIPFSWLHQTESPAARRKLLSTLSSSLPLILLVQPLGKENPFM